MRILEVYQESLQKLVQENLQKRKEQLQRKSLYRCNICKDTGWILRTEEKMNSIFDTVADRRNTNSEKWNKIAISSIAANSEAEPFWVADMDFLPEPAAAA